MINYNNTMYPVGGFQQTLVGDKEELYGDYTGLIHGAFHANGVVFACMYARKITGCPVRDLTAGFKAYRRETLAGIDLDKLKEDGYGFQIEIDFVIWRKGFRIKETPIVFTERRAGTSKMNKRIVRRAFFLVLRLRLQRIFGRA